jgi:16S rRNA (cytosine967-C5)-methyltransferase
MEPEENTDVVSAFLKTNAEFVVEQDWNGFPMPAKALKTPSGFLKTLPHVHDMDGFFSVRFKKTG